MSSQRVKNVQKSFGSQVYKSHIFNKVHVLMDERKKLEYLGKKMFDV